MSTFELYFELGLTHILDLMALDHLLFVVALCVVYSMALWRKVLVLVTAFTIGHSLTLALAVFGWITIPVSLIESLIPITIFITAIGNIWALQREKQQEKVSLNYFFALFFGLIHGMGFSNYLTSLLGEQQSIIMPLFAFNLGLEMGQLVIVILFFALTFVVENYIKLERKKWVIAVSSIAALASIYIFINTIL